MPDPARWLHGVDDPPRLLVVGGASLDIVHVRGRPTPSPGGAGLYTALAAARAGIDVTMLAPRPDPMPDVLAPALRWITWVGPVVPPDRLPRFEIAYDTAGTPTLYREEMGAEPEMTPELLDRIVPLPPWAYCVPFWDPDRQAEFVSALEQAGCQVVATTYVKAARSRPGTVGSTARRCRAFVCNEDEAAALFGDRPQIMPGHLLFVTRGGRGATVHQGDHVTHLPAPNVDALDTTGAGDTFCGTVTARLIAGDHPVEAARHALAAASAQVTAVGPARLLDVRPLPGPSPDGRAAVEAGRVTAVAEMVRDIDELAPFAFVGETWPPVGDPGALDMLWASTLQQWGFWEHAHGRWRRPMIATIDGTDRKGSDFLAAAYSRWLSNDPGGLLPAAQARLGREEFDRRLADDSGANPLPEPGTFHDLAVAYGATMQALGWEPESVVTAAAATRRPLASLLRLLDHVGGYREDPLRKKSALLGLVLRQRPERWVPAAEGDDAPPIVDYHVQRACLRTGMVAISDPVLAARVGGRRLVAAEEEDAIRRACHRAVAALVAESGRSMGAVDWFLFQMRRRCPEAAPPDCAACPADPVCAHRVDLFQPVLRTTAY